MQMLRIVGYLGTYLGRYLSVRVGEIYCPGSQVLRHGHSLHDILCFVGADGGKQPTWSPIPSIQQGSERRSIIIDAMKRSTERLSGPDSE